jgi:hypothetical protein
LLDATFDSSVRACFHIRDFFFFSGTDLHKSPVGRKANILEPNHAVLGVFESWGCAPTKAKQGKEEK